MSKEFDMYDTDTDDISTDKNDSDMRISVNKLPSVTEIKIDGKTISIINPEYVNAMQRKLTYMESKVKFLENEIKTLRSNIKYRDEIQNLRYNTGDYDYE